MIAFAKFSHKYSLVFLFATIQMVASIDIAQARRDQDQEHQEQEVAQTMDCGFIDRDAYDANYKYCLYLRTNSQAGIDNNDPTRCIECGTAMFQQDQSRKWYEVLGDTFVGMTGPIANVIGQFKWANTAENINRQTTQTYQNMYNKGLESCDYRYAYHHEYTMAMGASPLTPSDAANMSALCNGSAWSAFAGMGGMSGGSAGGVFNPWHSMGYSPGFLAGCFGPYGGGGGVWYPGGGNMMGPGGWALGPGGGNMMGPFSGVITAAGTGGWAMGAGGGNMMGAGGWAMGPGGNIMGPGGWGGSAGGVVCNQMGCFHGGGGNGNSIGGWPGNTGNIWDQTGGWNTNNGLDAYYRSQMAAREQAQAIYGQQVAAGQISNNQGDISYMQRGLYENYANSQADLQRYMNYGNQYGYYGNGHANGQIMGGTQYSPMNLGSNFGLGVQLGVGF